MTGASAERDPAPGGHADVSRSLPEVSVVIPTYARPRLLGRCLAALLAQSLEPRRFEIVVVDDERSPTTRALVERVAAATATRPAVRYVVPPPGARGPAAARNAGWRHARAGLIAFTDDDTVPAPLWLAAGLAATAHGVVAAAGRVVVPTPPRPTDYQRNVKGLERGEFVTANCFVRRHALEAVGGFDERFTRAWREDSDLHFSLLERFGRVGRAPLALVVHPARPAPWGVSLREQRNMLFDALLYKKHPSLYRARIRARPPLAYYAIAASLAVSVGGALAGHGALAFAGAATWALLTASFAVRRLVGTTRAPGHVAEMIATSAAIPLLAVYWRLAGAVRFRVPFV